jgi:hypothetical protein
MAGPGSVGSTGDAHPPGGRGVPPLDPSAAKAAKVGATILGSVPSTPAGELVISSGDKPQELLSLCARCKLSVSSPGSKGTVVDEKPLVNELADLIIKVCASQVPSLDPKSVTNFSIQFQEEKMELFYSDAGTEKKLAVNLTNSLKTWGDKDAGAIAFRKLQEASEKIKGFENFITKGQMVVDVRSPFVKAGSLGSRAAVDITGPLKLGQIASKDFLGKTESRSDFLAVKIHEACGNAGSKPVKSVAKHLEEVIQQRKRALENIIIKIDDKQKALAAADDAAKEVIRKQIKDLEELKTFLSIEPMESVPSSDAWDAAHAQVEKGRELGIELKVAVALMIKEQQDSLPGGALLSLDQMEKIAQGVESIYLGQKVASAWSRCLQFFGYKPSKEPAVESAKMPMYISKYEEQETQARYRKSAKQMAADTVALVLNLQTDTPTKAVKETYAELSDRLKTSMQPRDISDLVFLAATKTNARDRAEVFKTALGLNHILDTDLQTIFTY